MFLRVHLISIHAPRVGSDCCFRLFWQFDDYFNPRSPCGERRCAGKRTLILTRDFNPRSPCGERHVCKSLVTSQRVFQSTLPVWGATFGNSQIKKATRIFQSTLPVWGATGIEYSTASSKPDFNPRSPCGERPGIVVACLVAVLISIHAPRVGSDPSIRTGIAKPLYFNPRSPCGERRN